MTYLPTDTEFDKAAGRLAVLLEFNPDDQTAKELKRQMDADQFLTKRQARHVQAKLDRLQRGSLRPTGPIDNDEARQTVAEMMSFMAKTNRMIFTAEAEDHFVLAVRGSNNIAEVKHMLGLGVAP